MPANFVRRPFSLALGRFREPCFLPSGYQGEVRDIGSLLLIYDSVFRPESL